ncbi:hypothetical protein KJ742_06920 [Patescibacteria group bacterium]|nr:hypothetical protein [Patescibacteria group bacterium]MBU1683644.1 hypothetical protein [Patescibacteria group bacterium]MBU1935061.1 hypothetical protein [Patescibacteria group bacterium]
MPNSFDLLKQSVGRTEDITPDQLKRGLNVRLQIVQHSRDTVFRIVDGGNEIGILDKPDPVASDRFVTVDELRDNFDCVLGTLNGKPYGVTITEKGQAIASLTFWG